MIDPLIFIVVLVIVLTVGAYVGWKQHEREQPRWVNIFTEEESERFRQLALSMEEANRTLEYYTRELAKVMGVPGEYWK